MTAMSVYLVETRMSELRESRLRSGRDALSSFLAEAGQVLRGALTPVAGTAATLSPELRQDLGLR